MNEVIKCIKERRSIRKFSDKVIPDDILDEILTSGTYAASGMNRQSAIILAVKDRALRDRISYLNAKFSGKEGFDPFYGAPVVLVVLADKDISTYLYDGSLVMSNLMLSAHSLGIGSCWIHRAKEVFSSPEGKEILASLGIGENYEGIGNCILGYPLDNEKMIPSKRKDNYIYKT